MSKYVTRKHGLVLGSGNYFYVYDTEHPEGVPELRDGYRAIISTNRYTFDQIDILNVVVRTPAEQLLWKVQTHNVDQEFEGVTYSSPKRLLTLSPWFRTWLEKNVGALYDAWDTYTWIERDPSVFFKRRGDALKFAQEVDARLAGMRIRD